jgi:hypothetical protein
MTMKKLTILIISIFFMLPASAENDKNKTATGNTDEVTISSDKPQLPTNYQHFKYQLLNQNMKASGIPAANYRGRDDYTMLYVAGGSLVLTAGFILLNGENEYTGEFFDEANTGMLIGGGVSALVFTTKFFIDKYRN